MEIISFKKAPVDAKYIAEIEVYYKRVHYRRIRVALSPKGFHFINIPVYGEDDGIGGKRWVQFWEWTKDEDNQFKKECLEALKPYLNPQAPTSAHQNAPQVAYPGTYQPDLGDCPF